MIGEEFFKGFGLLALNLFGIGLLLIWAGLKSKEKLE